MKHVSFEESSKNGKRFMIIQILDDGRPLSLMRVGFVLSTSFQLEVVRGDETVLHGGKLVFWGRLDDLDKQLTAALLELDLEDEDMLSQDVKQRVKNFLIPYIQPPATLQLDLSLDDWLNSKGL